jgi:hypothetical protein
MWSHKCSENLMRGSCNHFAETAVQKQFVVDGLPGFSECVCVYLCIYIYMCVSMCIYI